MSIVENMDGREGANAFCTVSLSKSDGEGMTETFMWEHKIQKKKKKRQPRALQLADKNAVCL